MYLLHNLVHAKIDVGVKIVSVLVESFEHFFPLCPGDSATINLKFRNGTNGQEVRKRCSKSAIKNVCILWYH